MTCVWDAFHATLLLQKRCIHLIVHVSHCVTYMSCPGSKGIHKKKKDKSIRMLI